MVKCENIANTWTFRAYSIFICTYRFVCVCVKYRCETGHWDIRLLYYTKCRISFFAFVALDAVLFTQSHSSDADAAVCPVYICRFCPFQLYVYIESYSKIVADAVQRTKVSGWWLLFDAPVPYNCKPTNIQHLQSNVHIRLCYSYATMLFCITKGALSFVHCTENFHE